MKRFSIFYKEKDDVWWTWGYETSFKIIADIVYRYYLHKYEKAEIRTYLEY